MTKTVTQSPAPNVEALPPVGNADDLARCLKNITDLYVELQGHDTAHSREARASLARHKNQTPAQNSRAWQPMCDAPTDGKHCILAIKTGAFVYSIQGSFMNGKWMNAADIDAEPLCWMPNFLIPDEFLPWKNAAASEGSTDAN